MSLLERIRERCEGGHSDAELQAVLDAVAEEVARRHGSLNAQKVWQGAGGGRRLKLDPPVNPDQPLIVTEYREVAHGSGEMVLEADDFRLTHEGRILERLADGTNKAAWWAEHVTVIYTPLNASLARDEVILKVAMLDLGFSPVASERAGDWSETQGDVEARREMLLASLGGSNGLGMA